MDSPRLTFLSVLVWFSSLAFAADADLILHNGKIVTVDDRFTVRQAIAIKGNRIVALGSNNEILSVERGAATRLIDLKGRTVLPGLFDSHVHALRAALSEYRRPLPSLRSYADVQAYVRKQAQSTPKGQWIMVPLTFPTRLTERRMPTREVLDVATDHPVLFDASYVVVVNSYALKMCGITRHTASPPNGEILKDVQGEPTGILRNAQSLLKNLPRESDLSEDEKLTALEAQLKRYVAAGLTSIVDRAVTAEDIRLYKKLHAAKRLPLRVNLTWRLDASGPTEQVVNAIRTTPYPPDAGDEWLQLATFKVTLDGGMTIGTAYQREPYGAGSRALYAQTDPTNKGQLFVAPDKLTAIMRAARQQGWQLTAHSQGGGAVDTLLNTFGTLAQESTLEPSRSHVMHASFQSPEAIQRLKQLGVLADVQTAWLYFDIPALSRALPATLLAHFIPLREYDQAGIRFIGGSDHMIGHDKNRATNPYNPFLGMATSVTRRTVDGIVFQPEERVSREAALRSYSTWAAYLQKHEQQKGSLEPGKLADLVVLDRDYLTCPEDQLGKIEPVMVMVDGHVAAGAP